jgi:ketosteroid isomerase-like protein
MRRAVIMRWNEVNQVYMMLDRNDEAFLYDFWDCNTIRMLFENLDKEKDTYHIVDIGPDNESSPSQPAD